MSCMFSFSEMSTFQLTGLEYTIHNFVLKKMSLFSVLFEDGCDKTGMLCLEWNVSDEIIKNVFIGMYNDACPNLTTNTLSYCIETISFMKYLGIDESLVVRVCKKTMPAYLFNFINLYHDFEYHFEMKYICEKLYHLTDDVENYYFDSLYVQKIVKSKFHLDLKILLIQKFLIPNKSIKDSLNVFFGTIHSDNKVYEIYDHEEGIINIDHVKSFYEKLNFNGISYKLYYSKLKITHILINNKNIELDKLVKINEPGIIGYNIAGVISAHITKLLVGMVYL